MNFFKPHLEKKNFSGVLACLILSLACLGASIYLTYQLLPLHQHGLKTQGEIVGIEKGVKGSKTAILLYTTRAGIKVKTKDIYQMMLIRKQQGDHVSVLYDPLNPKIATIDHGLWTWHQPVILFLCFLLLLSLGIFLPRMVK